jgi:hypothetical protein
MAAGLSSHFISHLLCMYESSSSFSTTHSTPQPLHSMSDVTNASTSSCRCPRVIIRFSTAITSCPLSPSKPNPCHLHLPYSLNRSELGQQQPNPGSAPAPSPTLLLHHHHHHHHRCQASLVGACNHRLSRPINSVLQGAGSQVCPHLRWVGRHTQLLRTSSSPPSYLYLASSKV